MDQPQGPVRPSGTKLVVRIGLQAILVTLFVVTALLGALTGVLFAYASDLPQITALDNYQPNTITRLVARDGQVIGEFATERRVVIGYDDIAPALRQAIIASEDADFEQHFGLSITRILITVAKDILTGQRFGASTITQQVARMIFLQEYMQNGVFQRSGMVGLERKVKEAIIALQLEKRYTKREIFTFYANQVPLHYAHGVEAAARVYFDKPAKELTLEEAATIVATIPGPARLNPFDHPDRNLIQRNTYVLPRMAEEGFITAEQAAEAASRPLVITGQPTPERSSAPYFVEDVRKQLEAKYGAEALYQRGLRVQTTLDAELQEVANAAIDRGLRRLDKRRTGYRRAARNLVAEGQDIGRFTADRWSTPDSRGRHCSRRRHVHRRRRGPGPHRRVRRRAAARRLRLDAAHLGSRSVQDRRRDRGASPHARGQAARGARARTGARRGGGAAGDRQPHGPDPRDGRRLQLRAQQVQPGDAGAAPGRLAVQADCLHRRHRPWLHAGLSVHR